MDTEVIDLMVETVEQRLNKEVLAYQPAEEERRFVIQVGRTVMLIDEARDVFVPLNRGDPVTYLDLKKFLKEVDLNYKTRTEYGF